MKIEKNTPEALLLDIGRVLNEAGVTKEETLRALERARREVYGIREFVARVGLRTPID